MKLDDEHAATRTDALYDALPCGVLRVADGVDGRILYMNDAAREMLRGVLTASPRESGGDAPPPPLPRDALPDRRAQRPADALDAFLPMLDDALRRDATASAQVYPRGSELLSLLSPTWRGVYERSLLALPEGGACEDTLELRLPDGSRWVKCAVRRLNGSEGFLFVLMDVTPLKQQEDRIMRATRRDALTGVYTRDAFEAIAARRASQAINTNRRFALYILRVQPPPERAPQLTEYREAVKKLAEALNTLFRSGDLIARLSDDELAVWMTDSPDIPLVLRKGAEIARVAGERILPAGWACAVGAAAYPEHGRDYPTICRRARKAAQPARPPENDIHP